LPRAARLAHWLVVKASARERAVYYATPDGGMIREVIHPIANPNGIGLSPDGATLYVA